MDWKKLKVHIRVCILFAFAYYSANTIFSIVWSVGSDIRRNIDLLVHNETKQETKCSFHDSRLIPLVFPNSATPYQAMSQSYPLTFGLLLLSAALNICVRMYGVMSTRLFGKQFESKRGMFWFVMMMVGIAVLYELGVVCLSFMDFIEHFMLIVLGILYIIAGNFAKVGQLVRTHSVRRRGNVAETQV